MSEQPSSRFTIWTWAAFLASLIALAGSLYLSIGMGLVACPLCFYQRTFVMGVVGVLAVGLLSGARQLSLLALPAGVGAVGVAAFHVYLEMNGVLECPRGIVIPNVDMNLGTAPQQALAAQAVLLVLLVLDALKSRGPSGGGGLSVIAAVVLGGLFAWGAIASAPKPADPPGKPYDAAPKICRPPYKAASPAE